MGVKERKKREKKDRKAQILGAARTLLFKKGLEGTSINKIAALVELSVPAIYRYYANKDAIIFALSEEGLHLLQADITRAAEAARSPGQKLKAIAMAYRQFGVSQKDYFAVINHFLASPQTVLPDPLKQKIDRYGEEILMQVVMAVEAGCDSGQFVCKDSRRFSLMFWGAINGILQLQKIEHTIFADKDHLSLYQHTVETLINSIRFCPS
ncbi:MAG: TetR/AcrR family transcriptional regulator [Proteobacteria bacterium]|nr:TetR/AcrR family transcriptional regulator [Desulfobacula sp.]MBU3954201.1 TetR/AcrR family transcriptional regulator [Pseudomonadota bacterium]